MANTTQRSTAPDLGSYDWILVNSSAGKDSQTCLRQLVLEADLQGFPRERIVVVHADLGRSEWKGVKELAERQAAFYGLRFEVTARRQADGSPDDLLDYVERRAAKIGKPAWPTSSIRFCTSEFKRTPCGRILTQLDREVRTSRSQALRVLQVFGFRRQESKARAKYPTFELDRRASTKPRADGSRARTVERWNPIIDWTEDEVWADINESGVEHHEAYDAGMPRLSCVFCVFAGRDQLKIAGRLNPELLEAYVATERKTGFSFTTKLAIADIQAELKAEGAIS